MYRPSGMLPFSLTGNGNASRVLLVLTYIGNFDFPAHSVFTASYRRVMNILAMDDT